MKVSFEINPWSILGTIMTSIPCTIISHFITDSILKRLIIVMGVYAWIQLARCIEQYEPEKARNSK